MLAILNPFRRVCAAACRALQTLAAVYAITAPAAAQTEVFHYNASVERNGVFGFCPPIGDPFLVCDCSNSYLENNTFVRNVPSDTIKSLTRGWMGKIPNDRILSRISIPGTHDSTATLVNNPFLGCYTQRWTIREQLDGGIRFLDLRVRANDAQDGWNMYHGACNLGTTFDEVMTTIRDFLIANPTEAVIFYYKPEGDGDGNYASIRSIYSARYSAFWTNPSAPVPTLGSMRGKALAIDAKDTAHKTLLGIEENPYFNIYLNFDQDCLGSDDGSCSCSVPAIGCLGRHDATLPAFRRVCLEYVRRATTATNWIVNGITGATGVTPACVASQTNHDVFDYLNDLPSKTRVGVIAMDFPGEGVIYRIIKTNFCFTKRIDYAARIDCGLRAFGESQNDVTVRFYNGDTLLGSVVNQPRFCNGGLDTEFNLEDVIVYARGQVLDGKQIDLTHIVIETGGTDDAFIDQVRLYKKRYGDLGLDDLAADTEVYSWGSNGGGGWCLSRDTGPYNCEWYNAATCRGFPNCSDCFSAFRWEIGEAGPYATSDGGAIGTFIGNQIAARQGISPCDQSGYVFRGSPPPAPMARCRDFVLPLNANGQAALFYQNIDNGSFTPDNPGIVLQYELSKSDFTCADRGVNSVMLTVRNAGGAASCTAMVTVVDLTPPVINNCPPDITVNTGPGRSTCDQVVPWTAPTASDACGIAAFTSTRQPGDTFPLGQTRVTYTARDTSGLSSTCSFTVTVIDNTPPVITAPPATIELDAYGNATLTPESIGSSAIDNCQSATCPVTLSLSQTAFLCPPVNVAITITVTAVDCHNNTSMLETTVTFPDPDCNGNGLPDICDIISGRSHDCDANHVPDECQCVWDNGVPPANLADTEGQVSCFGAGVSESGGAKVADDMYLCPGHMHRIFFFTGEMLTNTPAVLRKARLELYEDCNGLPSGEPIFTLDSINSVELAGPNADGFTLVQYKFDLCDERLWLEGGKAYWWALVGLGTCDGLDYSSWVAADAPVSGKPPVKADGTALDPGSCYPIEFGGWQSLDACCIGCVNMSYRVVGIMCPIIWDQGSAAGGDRAGGILSENLSPTHRPRGADDFVVKPCEDLRVCLIDAWVWSNCNPVHGFLEISRNNCRRPGEAFVTLTNPTVIATDDRLDIDGHPRAGYILRFEPDNLTLERGQTWWLSAGADRTGSQNARTYFAYGDRCDAVCVRHGFPSQSAVPPLPVRWTDVGPDLAFRIAAAPVAELFPPIIGPPPGPVCRADINGDGIAGVQDIFDFLTAWFAGCP